METKIAEEHFKELCVSKGLQIKKVPTQKSKTPDFEIYREGKVIALAEVKGCLFNQSGGGLMRNLNCLKNDIKEASKQFKSYDKTRKFPRILIIVNYDLARTARDVIHALTGNFYGDDEVVYPMGIYKYVSDGRVKKYTPEIDLILWLDKRYTDNNSQLMDINLLENNEINIPPFSCRLFPY